MAIRQRIWLSEFCKKHPKTQIVGQRVQKVFWPDFGLFGMSVKPDLTSSLKIVQQYRQNKCCLKFSHAKKARSQVEISDLQLWWRPGYRIV